MKILHTADWHLGKKLEQFERTDEHQQFLNWLIQKLHDECIDVLIVAGDVFDSGSPSNTAFEQYYGFLRQVKDTCCREVIIIGGNHDSVSTLNAPRELLKYYNVHIVGGVPNQFNDQIIEIKNRGQIELVVCAVPFLRDKDVRLSVAGETSQEREERIRAGICNHYNRFKQEVAGYKSSNIPVIATGHLFAAGSATSDSEKEIHVGNLGVVCGDHFPEEFDYVALGHIHRPQLVGNLAHIRYSGSPVPLSFSETADRKQVVVLELSGGKLTKVEEIEVPCCRKLVRIKGDVDTVKRKLQALTDEHLLLPAWVEIQAETNGFVYQLDEQLQQIIAGKPFIEKLFIRQQRRRPAATLSEHFDDGPELTDFSARQVFIKKYEAEYNQTIPDNLLHTFEEVMQGVGL